MELARGTELNLVDSCKFYIAAYQLVSCLALITCSAVCVERKWKGMLAPSLVEDRLIRRAYVEILCCLIGREIGLSRKAKANLQDQAAGSSTGNSAASPSGTGSSCLAARSSFKIRLA